MKQFTSERGQAVILVALAILVFVGFVALAVDIGFVYVVKGQLQNAADAGALAAASQLDGTSLPSQFAARKEAQMIAKANQAAGESVEIDLNTGNSENGDIYIGYWDGSKVVAPPAGKFCNAAEVKCRRTKETGTGISSLNKPLATFFAKVIGYNEMNVSSSAVAFIPNISTAPMPLCTNVATLCNGECSAPITFYFKQKDAPSSQFVAAFTEFQAFSSGDPPQNTNYGPDSLVAQYIRGEAFPPDICNKGVYTNNAGGSQIVGVLRDEFVEETGSIKTKKGTSGNAYWDVVAPVGCIQDPVTLTCAADPCSPPVDSQGKQNKVNITSYVRMHITGVTLNPTPTLTVEYIKDIGCNPDPKGLGITPTLIK